MRCIRCNHDSKKKDRPNRTCPKCHGEFAFEPTEGDPLTDPAFKHAVEAVSANGRIRWGVEHLYYEVCRRILRRRSLKGYLGCLIPVGFGAVVLGDATDNAGTGAAVAGVGLLATGLLAVRAAQNRPATVPLAQHQFDDLWRRWLKVHGQPAGLIVRPEQSTAPARPLEADVADYSFDRAVICDRARTVDLLLANNFHFENNCAVLSVDGYPPGPFRTVRDMLKRNPRLQVFALHDASAAGCQLAHRLTSDPAWFAGTIPVTDVGLRPKQARAKVFRGLLTAPVLHAGLGVGQGLRPGEADWLSLYTLELAAIRPEQVLKRLFRAMNKRDADGAGGDGGGVVIFDDDSFSADAGDGDAAADSFG